jgi:hypothetical protein
MYKTALITVVLLSGCSYFRVTAPICDQINPQAGEIPKECRNYSQEEAKKAFDKVEDEKIISDKDIIEFHKEEK